MPVRHPYQEDPKGSRQEYTGVPDADRALSDALQSLADAGRELGAGLLDGVSEVLGAVGKAFGSRGLEDKTQPFDDWRRLLDRKLKNDEQDGWLGMAVGGWVFAAGFGIAALVLGILSAAGPGPLGISASDYAALPVLTACFVPIALGFSVMGIIGTMRYRLYARLRAYLRAARGWVSPVHELAGGAGQPFTRTVSELQRALAAGELPGVALSPDYKTLYWDSACYIPPKPAAVPETDLPESELFQREGQEFLRTLRACRGRLDATADDEIAAMEKNCQALLAFVRNHPEQLPRLRRMREYYLPTTRKLLDTAMGLGDTNAATAEHLRSDIAGVLHTLNLAYQKLYDDLLQDVRLDVSTEIDTLETMLRRDGLTHDFRQDFGLGVPQDQTNANEQ